MNAPTRFALRGENATVVAHDTMEIAAEGPGTRVTYTADFAFKGLAKFVGPLLAPGAQAARRPRRAGARRGSGGGLARRS